MGTDVDVKKYIDEAIQLIKDNTVNIGIASLLSSLILTVTVIFPAILVGPLMGGMFYILIDMNAGEPFDVKRLFDGFKLNAMPLVFASFLVSIFVAIGSLLVFPGIVISAWYMFTFLNIVDRDMEFWGAMESSREMTFKNVSGALALGAVYFVPIVGFYALMVALAWFDAPAIPMAVLMLVGYAAGMAFYSCFTFRAYINMVGLVYDPSTSKGGGRTLDSKPAIRVVHKPKPEEDPKKSGRG